MTAKQIRKARAKIMASGYLVKRFNKYLSNPVKDDIYLKKFLYYRRKLEELGMYAKPSGGNYIL